MFNAKKINFIAHCSNQTHPKIFMQKDITEIYQNRANLFLTQSRQLANKYSRFAFVRLLVFIAGIIVVAIAWTWAAIPAFLLTIAFLYGFYRFSIWHNRLKVQELQFQKLRTINEQEIEVLQHNYSVFNDGSEFMNPSHPYALDLDIFGAYSFFQYVNRTATSIGSQALAHFLLHPTDKRTILERQTAIKELATHLDWRQTFQAFGSEVEDAPVHVQQLQQWLTTPNFMLHNDRLKWAIRIAPIWAIAAIVAGFYLPWWLAILFLLPNILVLRKTVNQVNEIHQQTTHAEKILAAYSQLIGHIEQANFESPLLEQPTSTFKKQQAAAQIKRLSYYIAQLNVRYNFFAILLNVGGLWDLHWVLRLEKWKVLHQTALPNWFEQLAQLEALSSFANLHYNNPDWTFPSIHQAEKLEAEGIGHPLIHAKERITNDFNASTSGHIKLLTGSNMAGKSTFLRTIGLNIVLANIGAPVCAKFFRLPLMKVYTSMRTADALHESTSSFYAELKRLKFIIDAIEQGEKMYFLLDEILKGTNSKDRHTGSKALIQQLIESKGGGIIATHDLELGVLEAKYDGAIENICMEVQIKEEQLFFDYKLHKGVSQSFNATLLMKNMGIKIR